MTATPIPTPAAPMRISKAAEANFVAYGRKLLTNRQRSSQLQDKMELIDIAYARYKEAKTEAERIAAGSAGCDIFSRDEVTPPIVVSQVDSMVAYWAEVFLSGYPLFPVVSLPTKRIWAEQLEALIDDHATLGGYARQLLLFLMDGAKYNFCAVEADWDQISQFSVLEDYMAESGQKIQRDAKYYTRLERLDPYNVVYDDTVNPGDMAAKGDYAGYIKLETKIKLKKRLNAYSNTREVYNAGKAYNLENTNVSTYSGAYRMPPQVSDYITARRPTDDVDWSPWMGQTSTKSSNRNPGRADNYEIFTYYARIVPAEFGIDAPQPNTPQIWKVVLVNGECLIHAKRIISAYDCLPILFGQPLEDGLGLQTESVAEGAIEFQEAAKTLYNIRFAAARRSVSDRALYDPELISPSIINSKAAAPKIPVNMRSITGKTIRDAYHQIPFDMRGTETTLQDAATITEFAKELRGLNNAQRGQFQKGNKSVTEWNDTMGASDNRLRLSALVLEHQVFIPLKETLKLNIYQYGDNAIVVSQKSGEEYSINIAELRKHVLSFKVADGFTPKSKLASVDMLTTGLQIIGQNEMLAQAYGQSLPAIFAHMMQLGGVRGLDQYSKPVEQTEQPGGMQQNQIQEPNAPQPPMQGQAMLPSPAAGPGAGPSMMMGPQG